MSSSSKVRQQLMLLVLSLSASVPGVSLAGASINLPIVSINIYRGATAQLAIVTFATSFTNSDSCSSNTAIAIDFASTVQPDGKMLYSAALAGFLAGKQVQFATNGCASNGAPLVYSVDIMP